MRCEQEMNRLIEKEMKLCGSLLTTKTKPLFQRLTLNEPVWMWWSVAHTQAKIWTMKNMLCVQCAHEVSSKNPNQPEISIPCFTAKNIHCSILPRSCTNVSVHETLASQRQQSMLKSPSASFWTKISSNNFPHAAFLTSHKNTSILWAFYRGTRAKPAWLLSSRLQSVRLL